MRGLDGDERLFVGPTFQNLTDEVRLAGIRSASCVFDNCHAVGGSALRSQIHEAQVWSCSITNVAFEDCLVDGMGLPGGLGGRRTPLFIWGCVARRTVVRGRVSSIIWNGPNDHPRVTSWIDAAAYYGAVDDWAIDISEARFTSVPSLRYGPPGHLIRHDPEMQPTITRQKARAAQSQFGQDLGVWGVVMSSAFAQPWIDSAVLVPALGGPKRKYEDDLALFRRLRASGAFDAD